MEPSRPDLPPDSVIAAAFDDGRREQADTLVEYLREETDPGRALGTIVALRRELEHLEARHVDAALSAGWSWSRIGGALEISKQAAHRKHSRRRDRVRAAPSHPGPAASPSSSEAAPVNGRPRLRISDEARAAVQHARREAAALGASDVAPEHLLLGLASVRGAPAERALAGVGLGLERLRSAIAEAGDRRTAAWNGGPAYPGRLPIAPAVRAVLGQSLREALARGDDHLGVEHLLLALLGAPAAQSFLRRLGVGVGDLREALGRPRSEPSLSAA